MHRRPQCRRFLSCSESTAREVSCVLHVLSSTLCLVGLADTTRSLLASETAPSSAEIVFVSRPAGRVALASVSSSSRRDSPLSFPAEHLHALTYTHHSWLICESLIVALPSIRFITQRALYHSSRSCSAAARPPAEQLYRPRPSMAVTGSGSTTPEAQEKRTVEIKLEITSDNICPFCYLGACSLSCK